jgi:hypothetical protein
VHLSTQGKILQTHTNLIEDEFIYEAPLSTSLGGVDFVRVSFWEMCLASCVEPFAIFWRG